MIPFSILGFLLAVGGVLGLLYRGELLSPQPLVIGLQVLALVFMLWARATFGLRSFHAAANTTEGELVTRGPFALVRNPIYSAVILFTWAGASAHLNLASAALALLVLGGMLVRIHFEEQALRERYGAAYADYCRRVKRLVPFVF